MKKLIPFLLLLYAMPLVAQDTSLDQGFSVFGILLDSTDQEPLVGATMLLVNQQDTTAKKFTTTNPNGLFRFSGIEQGDYLLKVSYIGFKALAMPVKVAEENVRLGKLVLVPSVGQLDEVFVEGKVLPAVQNGDTTQFNAASFKTNPDASAEDLVRKMPGVTVESGQVKAQGEDVQQVLVDGKPFFGNDPTLALRNLPAEVVDKVEVFDQMSDQAQFTGFDDGETKKTINIITKVEMRNGTFGNVYAGYGDSNRYKAGGNINRFKDETRISVVGLSNNINEQNFSAQDLVGIASSNASGSRFGGRRGGGGRGGRGGAPTGGGGFGRGGDVSNFLVGQQGGINEVSSLGINYNDKWGEKIDVNGSYFFNYADNNSDELFSSEILLNEDSSQFYEETSLSRSKNYNHRFNMRMTYEMDENNSLIFVPSISFQDNQSRQLSNASNFSNDFNLLNSSRNNYFADNNAYNISGNLLYRHKFSKRGRTISVGTRTNLNDLDGFQTLFAENTFYEGILFSEEILDQQIFVETLGNTYSANVRYTEPLGRRSQLMLNASTSFNDNASTRNQFNYNLDSGVYSDLDSLLSNEFDNIYQTTRTGAAYRLRMRKGFLNIGAQYQYARLESEQQFPAIENPTFGRSFHNVLPNAMLMMRFSKNSNLRMFYRTRTNAPSISQLQEVIDNTDPLNLSSGNSDLDQQFSHSLIARYSKTNPDNGSNFFAFVLLQQTNNFITNATLVAARDIQLENGPLLQNGAQFTQPINLNGYRNARTYISFGKPVKALKSNLNLTTGISYLQTPGLINNRETQANTLNLSQGLNLSSNVSQNIDFTVSYTANYNVVKNQLQTELDNNYFYQLTKANANFIFWKGMVFNADLTHYLYKGLGDEFDQNFALVNLAIGKKFLKDDRGELRLSVFDLLKQNNSLVRTVTETSIDDLQTAVLQRYFMLTFNYRIRDFKGLGD